MIVGRQCVGKLGRVVLRPNQAYSVDGRSDHFDGPVLLPGSDKIKQAIDLPLGDFLIDELFRQGGHDELREWDCDAVDAVNRRYDGVAGNASAATLVESRLARSLWAKRTQSALTQELRSHRVDRHRFAQVIEVIAKLRTRISPSDAETMFRLQEKIGCRSTATHLAQTLADHGDPSIDGGVIRKLDPSGRCLTRRGPQPLLAIRPSRKSKRLDPAGWLQQPETSDVEFIDGDPDHVRVRGIELRSGDIGVVELDHPGDGIFDSFLETPGVAPHAMLFVSRRIKVSGQSEPLVQPSLFEIYEGGWRTVPVTTALGPRFSWYSQWVRPPSLPNDIGTRLSEQLDALESIAFDFQSRKIPSGGFFSDEWGQPSASCTNLIRIPMERCGVSLPYPSTEIHSGAVENLDRLGLAGIGPIHTPTNLLNDSGFQPVGVVDNGFPEWAYAQAMVVGRPDLPHTFGGHFCTRSLSLENLPDWKSIKRWDSARAALRIKIGQSNSMIGCLSRKAAGYTAAEIPRTASPTAIAFYLRSDMEAAHIIKSRVLPALLRWFEEGRTHRLSELQVEPEFCELIREGLSESALIKESWYQ